MPNTLNPRVAVYTGTFDPVHLGHLDIIRRGSRLFDRLIVSVGNNPDKITLFTIEERVQLGLILAGPLQVEAVHRPVSSDDRTGTECQP